MLGVLALTYMVAVVMGPELLHRRWNVPLALFPPGFTLIMIGLGLTLLYAVIRTKMPLVLTTLAASSIVFMIGVVHIILPAIDETGCPHAPRVMRSKHWHSAAAISCTCTPPDGPVMKISSTT